MKQYRLLLLPLVALVLMFASCATDFKVDAPYKNITVVYGLLNVDSGRNYIRIQKAFLDEHKSAIDMALVPDSNYYPVANLDVHLKELSGNIVLFDERLNRVNLKDEGFPKNSGTFFNDSNFAYKSIRKLNAAYTYRLVIDNKVTGEVDSAETVLINTSTDRSQFYVYQFNSSTPYSLGFPNNIANSLFTITTHAPDGAAYFEGIIRFHYVNQFSSGVEKDTFFDWTFASIEGTAGSAILLQTQQSVFYPVLRQGILNTSPPGVVARYIDSADIFVWAGSPEFNMYRLVNSAQGGITGDEVRPTYTNLKGTSVLGLFASRGVVAEYNVPIQQETVDSLKTNQQLYDLLIKGVSDH